MKRTAHLGHPSGGGLEKSTCSSAKSFFVGTLHVLVGVSSSLAAWVGVSSSTHVPAAEFVSILPTEPFTTEVLPFLRFSSPMRSKSAFILLEKSR